MALNTTLLVLGVLCVVAAVVGGGLKAAGAEFPPLASPRRQVLLAIVGVLVIAGAYLTRSEATPGDGGGGIVAEFFDGLRNLFQFGGGDELTITLSPSEGPHGTRVRVSGRGFQPGERVQIRVGVPVLAEARADTRGAFFDEQLTIPRDVFCPGRRCEVVATGRESIQTTTATFIATDFEAPGFPG